MKQTVSVYDFREAFRSADRMAGWTYEGLGALFEYLEDYEASTGEELELDVVALCCDFSEYGSAVECIEDCGYGFEAPDRDEDEDEDDYSERVEAEALEWLRDCNTVIEFDGGIIIQNF